MTSGSDPKGLSDRAARLEAMLDEIKDEPSEPPAAPVEAPRAASPAAKKDVLSTPDLDQLDADWGDEAPGEASEPDMLAAPPKGFGDDDEDDYDAKTVIGRVPDLVALTRKNAPEPSTQIKTPRAAPVQAMEPQREVPTIRPEPKVVIDDGLDPVIPPLALPTEARGLGAPAVPAAIKPPQGAPESIAAEPRSSSAPPDGRDAATRAADKPSIAERAAAKKAKERARADELRERKKARADAAARKQKTKQPRRSRPPPPPDSEGEAGGTSLDSDFPGDADADTGVSLVQKPRPLPLARDWRKMATLVAIVIAVGALLLGLLARAHK